MDFSKHVDELEQHVTTMKSSAHAAISESHDKLEQRIDTAEAELNAASQNAKQHADAAAADARNDWNRMKADVAAKLAATKARMDRRAAQFDATGAATNADWAESDADAAIDFAVWAIDNARVSVLYAIDPRASANQLGAAAR
jgi:hypothetical protein